MNTSRSPPLIDSSESANVLQAVLDRWRIERSECFLIGMKIFQMLIELAVLAVSCTSHMIEMLMCSNSAFSEINLPSHGLCSSLAV